ncbi:MAG: signal peptidase I [Erysipelotrichaceae bacterium]|nr:signal peptidase I [Erysipelotrichaceae bacterium]
MNKDEVKKSLLEYLKVIVITIIVTFIILQFIQISRVVGSSMEPTYSNGNIVLVDKVFYKNSEANYNDIVIVQYEDEQIIKRVIGLPGDHIEMINNQLYRNGELLEEDYILEDMEGNADFSYDIPEGKIFVMGDNRNNSLDSRSIGYVDFEEDVVGRVFLKFF